MSSYTLDPRLVGLVEKGVVTVTAVFTRTGTDVWVRSVLPHDRLQVYPHESMTVDEAVSRLAKLSGSTILPSTSPPKGGSVVRANTLASDPARVSAETVRDNLSKMTVAKAKSLARDNDLDTIKKPGGLVNSVPADSLCKYDLARPLEHLFARMILVAEKLTDANAVSRISSQPELFVGNVTTLGDWWSLASAEQKLILLSKAKKLNIRSSLSGDVERKLRITPCPFRVDSKLMEKEAVTIGEVSDVSDSNEE